MRMVLQARDLWEVVSGEEVKPETEKAAQAWDKKARKALAVIALAMTGEEKENIIECTTPKEAWDSLEKLYEGKGRNRKFMLLHELFHLSVESKETMDAYLRAVREKMSELSTIGLKLEDDIKLAIILNGLPEKYRYLVVSLENQEKIDFDELTARLMEEEKKLNPGAYRIALMAKKGLTLKCYGCGETGHVKANCPKQGIERQCYGCGEMGHLKKDCPKREEKKHAMFAL